MQKKYGNTEKIYVKRKYGVFTNEKYEKNGKIRFYDYGNTDKIFVIRTYLRIYRVL